MNENSQAYRDAFDRVRAAIRAQLPGSVSSSELDDAACAAVRAAFGMEN
jgi:hypothetical protein